MNIVNCREHYVTVTLDIIVKRTISQDFLYYAQKRRKMVNLPCRLRKRFQSIVFTLIPAKWLSALFPSSLSQCHINGGLVSIIVYELFLLEARQILNCSIHHARLLLAYSPVFLNYSFLLFVCNWVKCRAQIQFSAQFLL